jgi:hypothetical protein
MTPLRQRMLEDLQVRNLSPLTQRAYLDQVSRFRPTRVSRTAAATARGSPSNISPPRRRATNAVQSPTSSKISAWPSRSSENSNN